MIQIYEAIMHGGNERYERLYPKDRPYNHTGNWGDPGRGGYSDLENLKKFFVITRTIGIFQETLKAYGDKIIYRIFFEGFLIVPTKQD